MRLDPRSYVVGLVVGILIVPTIYVVSAFVLEVIARG